MNTKIRISLLVFIVATVALAADSGKPQYGRWGFDFDGMDRATKPGDDFFRYANGVWLDKAVIPGDKPGVSLRLLMTDAVEARLHQMFEELGAKPATTPAKLPEKVGAFYRAFMDEARIEQAGAKPIAAAIAQVRAAGTREALASVSGGSNYNFASPLFVASIDSDLKNPDRYAVYLGQSGLGLPDRDYYLDSKFTQAKIAYQAYVEKLLGLAGWSQADKAAAAVVDFETRVAKASWSKTEQRDLSAVYNPMSVAELQKFAPGYAWRDFLRSTHLEPVDRVVVAEKSAFPKIAAAYAETPIDVLRAWQAFHIADNAAPYLSKSFVDAHFELHNKTLEGQKEPRARWKRAVLAIGGGDFGAGNGFGVFGTMGFGAGQLYTAKYFPPEAKAKIETLVQNLKAAYRTRIEKLDWMGPATKAEALKKLDTYRIKVGYPDHPRDYSKVAIRSDDVVSDVLACAAADWEYQTSRLNSPVDRDDWLMTPQTNDAYNGSLRDIVFPAGILQPPIFDPNADPAVNYGAIGGVIGHELTHGFDDQGRKIDAAGALRDWWTADDAKKFDERAKRLGAQYSKFEPLPGVFVKGELTMGENIADLGGLTLGLEAYHASLKGQPAPMLDGMTGDQRVLLGWAQAWRGKVTDDYVKRQVVSDPHSPRQFRVNGVVRNLDSWYSAFGVKAGEKLYVPESERVRIW